MLFNSYIFIFGFLPIALAGYFVAGKWGSKAVLLWLTGVSLFFYSWWNPPYVLLLIFSIGFNYTLGLWLSALFHQQRSAGIGKWVLIGGVLANLSLLGYFKYANFFMENLSYLTGQPYTFENIFLPLGISFFTFQQVAYLADAYQGQTEEHDFFGYATFVSFFPQLIAGPIVHHKQLLPQFTQSAFSKPSAQNMAVGLSVFFVGLGKKVLFADSFARVADQVFKASEAGTMLSMWQAWEGALAYTFQIYFDFSGYSDMAIGLGLMFGVALPINFNSPYKARSIIDFWRRWHMTLSQFLRDYLYIPLGGSRKGSTRRYTNLMLTMLLGGLWHGAGWTFVIWGGLHGLYLMLNHFWRHVAPSSNTSASPLTAIWQAFWKHSLTLLAVIVAWVFFRAVSLEGALHLLGQMSFLEDGTAAKGLESFSPLIYLLALVVVIWGLNPVQLFAGGLSHKAEYQNQVDAPGKLSWLLWKPSRVWAIGMAIWAVLAVVFVVRQAGLDSPFLYFQF